MRGASLFAIISGQEKIAEDSLVVSSLEECFSFSDILGILDAIFALLGISSGLENTGSYACTRPTSISKSGGGLLTRLL